MKKKGNRGKRFQSGGEEQVTRGGVDEIKTVGLAVFLDHELDASKRRWEDSVLGLGRRGKKRIGTYNNRQQITINWLKTMRERGNSNVGEGGGAN